MGFLGRPELQLGTPTRTSPTSPGTVVVSYSVPLFVELLERCMIKNCDDAAKAPIFQVSGELWTTDRSEPAGTFPITPDQIIMGVVFDPDGLQFRKILGNEITAASPVQGRSIFQILLTGTMRIAESRLNEDWGPSPPPGKPALSQTLDEIYLRVYLASLFSAWQTIQTIDSDIKTGQFYGP